MAKSTIKNVVVIGGSYVGLNLAESLARESQNRFRVLLIEKNSHFQHLFAFPRYAVSTKVDTHKAFIPFQKSRLGQDGVVVQASAISLTKDSVVLDREVDLDGKRVTAIPYAALAITTGTKLSPPSTLPGSEKLAGTTYLRKHVAHIARSEHVAVIGGGAVGVQMATDIAELYPGKHITLIHSRDTLMSKFDSRLHDIVAARCEELGIDLVLGRGRVKLPEKGYPTDGSMFDVELADGSSVGADFAIVSTGQTPQSSLLTTLSPESVKEDGFILVRPTLQISSPSSSHTYDNIFALGDVADTGAHKAARPALKQAEIATRNIFNLVEGHAELEDYVCSDPAAIHLTLGIEKSVIFRNPKEEEGGRLGEPVIMHKDDGRLDMGIDAVWGRRGADVTQSLL